MHYLLVIDKQVILLIPADKQFISFKDEDLQE